MLETVVMIGILILAIGAGFWTMKKVDDLICAEYLSSAKKTDGGKTDEND